MTQSQGKSSNCDRIENGKSLNNLLYNLKIRILTTILSFYIQLTPITNSLFHFITNPFINITNNSTLLDQFLSSILSSMSKQQLPHNQKITLGYWALRGRGQLVRHLLSYLKFDFDQVQYSDVKKWFGQDKPKLGFNFPNLPWLTHGDFKLTQMDAICRYLIEISQQPELLGKNIQDQALVTSIYGVVFDAIKETNVLFYDKEYESKLGSVWDKVKPKFDYLNNFIKERKTCLDYLTYVDFMVAEFLCHYVPKLYPEQSKNYAFMTNIRDYVESLEGVKAYYERADAIKEPHVAIWMAAIKY